LIIKTLEFNSIQLLKQ